MKKLYEVLGVVLLFGGVSGVIQELTGWFPFMGYTRFLTENVDFLAGRAVFTNIVIAVVGFAVLMIADRRGR
ncbi:hypothetical protein GCM10010232_53400 [Streptomyces amakusaensis]|uniref:Integral membrane protein n=1 Tax=Streptomyces amakusaensis TaxID=67271 RepID=A0ABW0AR55_9ACTN